MSANSCESETIVGSHTHIQTHIYTKTLLSSILCCWNLNMQTLRLNYYCSTCRFSNQSLFLWTNQLCVCTGTFCWLLLAFFFFFLPSVSYLSWRCEAWIVLDVSLNQENAAVCIYSFLSRKVVKKDFPPLISTDKMQDVFFIEEKTEQGHHDCKMGYVQFIRMIQKGSNTSYIFSTFSSTL